MNMEVRKRTRYAKAREQYGKYGHRQLRRQPTRLHRHKQPQTHHRLFLKGSSMVGSGKRGRQLLQFRPTKKMQAQGFQRQELRFHDVATSMRMGLDFTVSPRQDWINKTVKDLKIRGLL